MFDNLVRPKAAVWRSLLMCTSPRTRGLAAAASALGAVGRLAVVGTALQVARADARGAAVVGAAAGAVFIAQRFAHASLRVRAECDLYRGAARALLEADVLEVPQQDVQRVVFEANHVGRSILATTLPNLVADAVASTVIAPVLASLFPARVLLLLVMGLVFVLGTLLALRRVTARMQTSVLSAAEEVAGGMLVAVEGRLELVARGGEVAFASAYDATLAKYTHMATRASLASALLGRVPLLVGGAAVAAVALIDGGARDALATTLLGEALLLAAAMPALLGIVFGVHELVRAAPIVAPFVTILASPRRAESSLPESDLREPSLPAPFSLEQVTFAYDNKASAVLTAVDASWKVGEPLVVLGPNGGGKSTVLRLLMGLRPPTTGIVALDGVSLTSLDLRSLRQRMAYLPQRPYLGEPYNSVRYAMRLGRADASDTAIVDALARARVLLALEAKKADPLSIMLGELSAGQRQRVALARILLQDAPIVLLDEPDANLDRDGVSLVATLVAELVASGKMVVIAAHAPELGELSGSRIVVGAPPALKS